MLIEFGYPSYKAKPPQTTLLFLKPLIHSFNELIKALYSVLIKTALLSCNRNKIVSNKLDLIVNTCLLNPSENPKHKVLLHTGTISDFQTE